ncbi:hypothetical protein AB4133_19950 [Vibrio sp. 10N.286.52.F8]|uniref:hypothetical protein n=1 Tax=Vibrio sp. 10N.286.52.F8 TaxID=3229716 RepID=UPI00354EDDA0
MLSYGMTQAVAKASTERAGVTRYATKLEASAGLNEQSVLTPSSMYSVFRDALAFYEDVHHSVFAENLEGQIVDITLPKDAFSAEFCVKWSGNDAVTATVHAYQEDGVTLAQGEFTLRNGEQVTHNFGRRVNSITISLPPTPNSVSGSFKVSNAVSYRGYQKNLSEDAQYFVFDVGGNYSAKGFSTTGRFGGMSPPNTLEGYEWGRLITMESSRPDEVKISFVGDTSLNGRTVVAWVNGISSEFVLTVDGAFYSAWSQSADMYALINGSPGKQLDIQLLFL